MRVVEQRIFDLVTATVWISAGVGNEEFSFCIIHVENKDNDRYRL